MFQNYCPKLVRFTTRAGGDGEAGDIAETLHGWSLAPVHRYMVPGTQLQNYYRIDTALAGDISAWTVPRATAGILGQQIILDVLHKLVTRGHSLNTNNNKQCSRYNSSSYRLVQVERRNLSPLQCPRRVYGSDGDGLHTSSTSSMSHYEDPT